MNPAVDKRPFYVVKCGRQRGIYRTWDECVKQTRGYPRSAFKKFKRREDADAWLAGSTVATAPDGKVVCFSDGSSIGNGSTHARAGAGVWFGPDDRRNISERLPGERQTNQRAEIYAAIRAIEAAGPDRDRLRICTDSKYVIQAVDDWIPRLWLDKDFEGICNADLFRALWALVDVHRPIFEHVPGHSNIAGNEHADALARRGANAEAARPGIGGLHTGVLFGNTPPPVSAAFNDE